MRVAFGIADARRQRDAALLANDDAVGADDALGGGLGKAERRLTAAEQFEIDLGQNLGVEQGAVLGAARIVDAVFRAERVEVIGPGRMLAARQRQRIDQTLAADQRPLDHFKFGAQEFVVEFRIVDDQRRVVADEPEKLVADVAEAPVRFQEFDRQPVNGEGFRRHIPVGIEIGVKRRAGRDAVEQLDAADFDEAMTLVGIQPGGFGVEDDFAHVYLLAGTAGRITAAVSPL